MPRLLVLFVLIALLSIPRLGHTQSTDTSAQTSEHPKAQSTGEKVGEKSHDVVDATKSGAKKVAGATTSAAKGVKKGWASKDRVNVNTASIEDLEKAGLTADEASTVIAARPFQSKADLQRTLGADRYRTVSGHLSVK